MKTGYVYTFRYKSGDNYDIMFLDHMMPDMDGIELLTTIKSLKDYECPPIVALTANAIAGSRKVYLDEGFDDYIPKPIDLNELDQVINKYLKDK
jgi:CheY-like chemotaxis protein